ncbi:protection of telomeres protein 1a-like isoform X4 [Malus domestica]|uniref:protection of telomeres protein 1a-like isoform X4 n=1 Tax=Malus domestica TaxID=3750 RepID=UPI0039757288
MPRGGGNYYNFTKIRDAIDSVGAKVNVIGVVLECGFPRQTRGTDWFVSVRIIDETHQDPGLSVNIFTDRNECPRILSVGDIIQFQRVTIIHIHEGAGNEWMAFVWDGTDAPPADILQKLEDEMKHPLPLHLEPFPLPSDTLCSSFPAVGTVLRVISQDLENDNLRLLKTGEWVKLVNLLCEVHAGIWRCVLTPFTKLRYTPKEDRLKLERKRLFNEQLAQSPESLMQMPFGGFPSPQVTEVDDSDDDHAIFLTLMDVVASSEVPASFKCVVPASFKCVVRVIAAFPWQAADFLFPAGIDRIRLTLEDSTARIHAFLYAEDGVKFFGGQSSVEALEIKRNALLGVRVNTDGAQDDTRRNPPWVQVRLKSETNQQGNLHYRVFGTKVVAA